MSIGVLGKGALLAGLTLAGLLGYALYRDFAQNDCGLSEPDARARVARELAKRGWPLRGLGPAQAAGTCSYEYEYLGAGKHYSFAVLSTWGHGLKLAWYDHSQDSGPAP